MAAPVYLDTNVFVYLKEGFGDLPASLLQLVAASGASGSARLATCEITLAELLTKPLAEGRADLVDQYENWMITSDWLQVVPTDLQVLRAAATLRASYKAVKLPDAIHLVAAIGLGCDRFLTADQGLKGEYRLLNRDGKPGSSAPVYILRPTTDTISQLAAEFSST